MPTLAPVESDDLDEAGCLVVESVAAVVSAPVVTEENEAAVVVNIVDVDGAEVAVAIKSCTCHRIDTPYASKLLGALVTTVDSGTEPEVFVVIV